MLDPAARLRYLAPLVVGLAAAVAVTLAEGVPRRLPAVALGSVVLLHALRAGALVAIGIAVATVLLRASTGRLPTQLSTTGIGYDETTSALDALQQQVDDQQAVLEHLAERLDALPPRP
jgi:ABC-type transport system involved in cytochrome bd biosynthesis fused ATPase/permease subunit